MWFELSVLKSEYELSQREQASGKIAFGNGQIAELRNLGNELYNLSYRNQKWLLSKKVDGEVRPFSIVVFRTESDDLGGEEVLKIKDHIFFHRGNFYILGGIPQGGIPKDHLSGSKYVCRLTNFPFSHPDQVDAGTKNRLKRHRGVPVGEFFGLGSKGSS